MSTNVESRLSEMLPAQLGELSILERKVSTYLLKHEDKLMGMDISEIAKASGVSKATVVRFCKALGFNGLKDFKIYYEAGKSQYSTKLTKLSSQSSPDEIIENMKNGVMRAVEKTFNEENNQVLIKIADEIQRIGKVTILCSGCDQHKIMISNRLSSLGIDCKTCEINDAIAGNIGEGVVIIYSSTCEIDGIGPYVKRGKDRGCKFVTITSNPKAWLACNSEYLINIFNEKLIAEDRYILSNFAVSLMGETLYAMLVSRK